MPDWVLESLQSRATSNGQFQTEENKPIYGERPSMGEAQWGLSRKTHPKGAHLPTAASPALSEQVAHPHLMKQAP